MSERRGTGSNRGTFEWALAVVASTLAKGIATRQVHSVDLEEAADTVVSSFRDLGHEVVLLPEGIWDLTSLADGEELAFVQAVLRTLLERHNLELIWEAPSG